MVENSKRRCVALAFQGGVIPAGTFAAGVVKALVDCNAFDKYDICTFSGTSSGALVAAMCWGHSLKEGGIKDLPKALSDLWLDIAFGTFPNEVLAQGFILGSQAARATPLGDFIIQNMGIPFVRRGFEEWVSKHIQFEAWRDSGSGLR